MADVLLEVKNLVRHFPVKGHRGKFVHAVDDVSFKIERGKTFGLVGESGCGKSTCAPLLGSMSRICSIQLDGVDITHLSQRDLKPYRKHMQMIFQDPYASLNARMTVRDIIAEPLRAHQITANRAEEDALVIDMLRKVGLNREHATRYAHEFSGGQRQRIGISRALILKPDLVICDEPISALDVSIQAQIINLLKELQTELALTYLFIAHDLSMVRYVSDEVGVMYLGKLAERCETEALYRDPLHPYTQGLLKSMPIPDPTHANRGMDEAIQGDIPSPIDLPPGCRFHTRCRDVLPICRDVDPVLKDVGGGHYVACHLY